MDVIIVIGQKLHDLIRVLLAVRGILVNPSHEVFLADNRGMEKVGR